MASDTATCVGGVLAADGACSTVAHIQATSFVPTGPSWIWLVVLLLIFVPASLAYRHLPTIPTTEKQMASFALLCTAIGFVPSFAFLVTGVTWTGMNLGDVQRSLIDRRHVVLMFLWGGISATALVARLVDAISAHKLIGRFGLYVLLPAIFFELHFNAAFVFFPEKPIQLAQALATQGADPTWTQIGLYSLPFSYSLLTPVAMIACWWGSVKSLENNRTNKRDIRMHLTYMTLFVFITVTAGFLRWMIKFMYSLSPRCDPHVDADTSILIQVASQCWCGAWQVPLVTAICATVHSDRRRNDPYFRGTYYFYVWHAAMSLASAGTMGVPSAIACS